MAAGQSISYTLPESGNVSINIYDSTGAVVRELLHTAPRVAGTHTEYWDGLDTFDYGLLEGSYPWKLVSTPGFVAEYAMTVGSNYPTGSEMWQQGPGCHGGAAWLAVDDTGLYVGSIGTEGVEPMIQKLSKDGTQFFWGIKRPVPYECISSLAVHNGVVYAQRTDEAGQRYEIILEFFKQTGDGTIKLEWESLSQARTLVPASRLFSEPLAQVEMPGFGAGLKGEYFDNPDWTNLAFTRTDPGIDFAWGTATPDPAITGSYSVSWTGTFVPRQSGDYKLMLTIGVVPSIRGWLYIDGELVLDEVRRARGSAWIWLEAGQAYPIEVLHQNIYGNEDSILLEWRGPQGRAPGGSEVLPQSQLIPMP